MIIDIFFFVIVLILLHQLSRKISKKPPAVDTEALNEFKRIMAESQDVSTRFITATDNNVQALNKLIRQLDDKEKTLIMLLEEAGATIKKLEAVKCKPETAAAADRYDEVVQMVQQGLSREEILLRSGFNEGEIDLVIGLARARTGKT